MEIKQQKPIWKPYPSKKRPFELELEQTRKNKPAQEQIEEQSKKSKHELEVLELHERINGALRNISGQLSLNFQLVVANDNYNHYKRWAETQIKHAVRVIDH